MEHLEIISREMVRPSYPTPQNLQTYKISMLDQAIPSVLSPFFLYYFNDDATKINGSDSFISQTKSQLKKSLSAILTRFYPFAGRASGDGQSIDCNDDGVPFVVAKFKGHNLSHLLNNNPPWRKFLIPCDLTKHVDRIVLQIQINYFDCGGVAVASVFWHRASDAVTMAAFLNSWAATARGSNQAVCPNYISPSLFPQTQDDLTQIHVPLAAALLRIGRSVLRGYTLDAAAIAALKTRSGLERASRAEVVSALIWKCFMAASRAINGDKYQSSVLLRAVNLRRRAYPAFSADCFGNFQGLAAASSSNDGGKEIGDLVRRMRDSLAEIGVDYVESLRGEGGAAAYVENRRRILLSGIGIGKGGDCLYMTSLCGLGFNGCDFGWGKPVRYGTYGEGSGDSDTAVFANSVSLVDSRDGDGIEVGIVVDSRYVSPFENHLLLLLPQSSNIHNHIIISNL